MSSNFLWPGHLGTLQILEGRHVTAGSEAELCPIVCCASGEAADELYAPLEEFPGLFITFAEIGNDSQKVIDFAGRYGFLEKPRRFKLDNGDEVKAEPFAAWKNAIKQMQEVISLWTSLDRNVIDESPLVPDAIISQSEDASDMRYIVQDFLGPLIEITRIVTPNLANKVTTRLVLDARAGTTIVQQLPHNLLTALWLQVAAAISEGDTFRRCSSCSKYFPISAKTAKGDRAVRNDKQFCSNSCRALAFRLRQDLETKDRKAKSKKKKRKNKK